MKRPVERAAKRIELVEWGGDAWLLPAGSRAASGGRGSGAFSDATEGSFEAGMEMRSGVRGRTRTSELIGSETDAALGRASEKNAEDLGQCDGERRGSAWSTMASTKSLSDTECALEAGLELVASLFFCLWRSRFSMSQRASMAQGFRRATGRAGRRFPCVDWRRG